MSEQVKPATAATVAAIEAQLKEELDGTDYACSSFVPLAGGTANYVFAGNLTKPLEGQDRVVIKHAEGYVRNSPHFKLSTARCGAETLMLEAAHSVTASGNSSCQVRTPRLYSFNATTSTQIQEYLENSIDLKHYVLAHWASTPVDEDEAILRQAVIADLGGALGAWLSQFHEWANEAGQRENLQGRIADENAQMKGLKHMINYEWLLENCGKHPDVLGDAQEVFEKVAEMAKAEWADERSHIIHGDFWTGNILLPNRPMERDKSSTVFVVDWEMCHVGVRALDLGQMIAELYQLSLFKDIDAGLQLVGGFLDGYGGLDKKLAYRTAISVGAHLICFGSTVDGWDGSDRVEKALTVGKDLILRAWNEDRAWFEDHPLGRLLVANAAASA